MWIVYSIYRSKYILSRTFAFLIVMNVSHDDDDNAKNLNLIHDLRYSAKKDFENNVDR